VRHHLVDQAHLVGLLGGIAAAQEPDLAGALLADMAGQEGGAEARIDRTDLGADLPNCAFSEAMVRSHRVAKTLPPPMAKPCTRAMVTLRTSRMALWQLLHRHADGAARAVQAVLGQVHLLVAAGAEGLFAAPPKTMALTVFSSSARLKASISSSTVCRRKALSTSGG